MKIILKPQGEKATPLKISRIWSQHTSVRARWAKVVKEFDRAERFGTLLRRWLSAEKSTWPAVKMFCGAATWNTSLWWDWLTKGARQKSGIAARKLYLQWKDPTQKTRNTGDQMDVLAKRLKHCEPLISRHRQLTEANYHIKKKKKAKPMPDMKHNLPQNIFLQLSSNHVTNSPEWIQASNTKRNVFSSLLFSRKDACCTILGLLSEQTKWTMSKCWADATISKGNAYTAFRCARVSHSQCAQSCQHS